MSMYSFTWWTTSSSPKKEGPKATLFLKHLAYVPPPIVKGLFILSLLYFLYASYKVLTKNESLFTIWGLELYINSALKS